MSAHPEAERPGKQSPSAQRLPKRQIDDDDDDDGGGGAEHQPKRARLTRQNLALLEKMANKTPKNSESIKTTSATSSCFAIQAFNNGILDPRGSKPPANLEDIRSRLAKSRATASPPASVYEGYVNKVKAAVNEATMVFEVGGRLLKDHDTKGYQRAFCQSFTNFPEDVGFNDNLSYPQPDFVEGLEMQEYRPFPVDEHVPGAVLYKDNPHSVTLPHLAGEWKDIDKDMEWARLQSAYDGAALVYARNQALAWAGASDPPGHAAVTTFTTDGSYLNVYAHYATTSEEGTVEYHQYPVHSTSLVNSYDEHKTGRRWIRNGQDYAKEESYALKDRLKAYWKQRDVMQPMLPSEATPSSQPFKSPTPGGGGLKRKASSVSSGHDEAGPNN